MDAAGNAYVTGYTVSANFPTSSGAFQTFRLSMQYRQFSAVALMPS